MGHPMGLGVQISAGWMINLEGSVSGLDKMVRRRRSRAPSAARSVPFKPVPPT
jgi:hypothetical protein